MLECFVNFLQLIVWHQSSVEGSSKLIDCVSSHRSWGTAAFERSSGTVDDSGTWLWPTALWYLMPPSLRLPPTRQTLGIKKKDGALTAVGLCNYLFCFPVLTVWHIRTHVCTHTHMHACMHARKWSDSHWLIIEIAIPWGFCDMKDWINKMIWCNRYLKISRRTLKTQQWNSSAHVRHNRTSLGIYYICAESFASQPPLFKKNKASEYH